MPIFPPSQKPADLAMWQEGPALTAFTKPNPPGSCQEGGCVVETTHLALVSQSASIKWAQKVVGGVMPTAHAKCQKPGTAHFLHFKYQQSSFTRKRKCYITLCKYV